MTDALATATDAAATQPEDAQGLPAYRTTLTLLAFGLMILAVIWFCTPESRPVVAPVVVGGLVTLGCAAAAKSGWQHHVNSRADVAKAAQG